MKLEHAIRHLLLLFLFCSFLAVMVISIKNLFEKVGVSIGVKESKIHNPAFTICPFFGSELTNLMSLGNGTTFTMPSWIEGVWLTSITNDSVTM
jgi:hypothetical protein